MPIKPENKARYPKHWKAIRGRILERAGHACEGSPDFPDCRRPNGLFLNKTTGETSTDPMQVEAWTLADGDKVTRVVLTIAHLDHVPENCDEANLRAWCQRCHLRYDHNHHQINSAATRKRNKAVADLFAHLAA